jgi:lipopolysaccharide export system permease protein
MIYRQYLLNKTLVSFFGIITVLVLLIWFSRAVPFVHYITENGVELSQFFYLFILILPWLLLLIIPVSLFSAILLTFNRLIATNEITILKNSGLTQFQICKPIIILAAISSLLCAIISFYLMPYANKQLRISKVNIQDNYTNLSFNPQTFETLKALTIYAKSRDDQDQLNEILLHDMRSDTQSITITAKRGTIVIEDKSALLYMEEGTIQKYNDKTSKSEILYFDKYVFNLTENNKGNTPYYWKAKERYLGELMYPEENVTEDDLKRYASEIHERFTYPLFSLVFSLIALSTILRGQFRRGGNISNMIMSIVMCCTFMVLTITSFSVIEASPNLTFLPYLNCLIFLGISIKMLYVKPSPTL